MGETSALERGRGAELVVGRQQSLGPVQDGRSASLGEEQLEEPGLDAVQRRQHIEARQDDVTDSRSQLVRIDDRAFQSQRGPRRDERRVRLVVGPAEHDHA